MLNIKNDFPWFKNNKGWYYLDSAASSLKPTCVINTINEFNSCYCFNPHNNDSPLTSKLNIMISNARNDIANFFNTKSENIIFCANSTDGLNKIVNNIKYLIKKKSGQILITNFEHASNHIPWINFVNTYPHFKLKCTDLNTVCTTKDILKNINKDTCVVSFNGMSNLFGTTININELVKYIRSKYKDIIIICDATQYLTTYKIDVKKTDIDFLVCSAHKLCGPTGIGLYYGKTQHLLKFKDITFGGGMSGNVDLETYELSQLPNRLEAGTINSSGILAMATGIKYLEKIRYKNIYNHKKLLKQYIDQKIKNLKGFTFYNWQNDNPIIAFNYNGVVSQDLANFLGNNKIIVRAGASCVKLQHNLTNCKTGVVRASFSIYNTKDDVDYLFKVLNNFTIKDITKKLI